MRILLAAAAAIPLAACRASGGAPAAADAVPNEAAPASAPAAPAPVPAASPAPVRDVAQLAEPRDVTLEWYVGDRYEAMVRRLLQVDLEALLEGFRNRPGKHPWIGEHAGKWLHAATLAWDGSGNRELEKRIDYLAAELLKTQEPDGYLGTYEPSKRFGLYPGADWDVWVHKYCMIGLLTYGKYRERDAALEGARRAADLLIRTFGPGKKSIIQAGTHVGMAATSVLEPVVLLYQTTKDPRYLEFAKHIVDSYESPGGPKIVSSLLEHGSVRRTANAKAYEMLSNLVGLLELYRVTGESTYLKVCEAAWKDIVENRMYVTGGVSLGEHFQDDGYLPNAGAVAETCADVTWEQFNIQLLRLTGEAKYADVLERLVFNHLFAAQHPDGSGFCYFTPLEGKKEYGPGINCCVSSGPRGIALIPTFAFTARGDSIDVNLFLRGEAGFVLADGKSYRIEQRSRFPSGNKFFFRVVSEDLGPPVKYRVRVPSWATPGGRFEDATWKEFTEEARFELDMSPRVVLGTGLNAGRAAVLRGPVVYCLEARFNPGLGGLVALAGETAETLALEAFGQKDKALYDGQAFIRAKGLAFRRGAGGAKPEEVQLVLSDFANAGLDGGTFKVYIPVAGRFDFSQISALAFGRESWSRAGNVEGRIADEDLATFRVTYDGRPAEEDWYAVEVDEAVRVSRVFFAHGRTFHDGGWFDASRGKPRIEVRRSKGGAWESVAELASYPETTATDSKGLREGQRFAVALPEPIDVYGVRVVGRPASGDRPDQAFSSCAELGASE